MRCAWLLPLVLASCAPTVATQPPPTAADRAARWHGQVSVLASDAMEGRAAGTPGHERAAAYVANEMQRLGLEPAGTAGYLQPIGFTEQRTDYAASSLSLSGTPVTLPETATVSPRYELPATLDAPLVFIGYGLHMPSVGHDDLAGVDLRGKIAVFVSGGPAEVSGTLKAHARAQRNTWLAERGAVGAISITTPGQTESPWSSAVRNANQPGMTFADATIRDEPAFVSMGWNPAEAERLFAGASRTFAQVAADADASRPLPSFAMQTRLSGRLAATGQRSVTSPNVVARLPGSDPSLADEHVVLTAHLDGIGVGTPVNGDSIYNGALDNAAGVAALIDIADELRRQRPARSILFVFVTAEEKGLLGASYLANNPVGNGRVVGVVNLDMPILTYDFQDVVAFGAEHSEMGTMVGRAAQAMNVGLTPDPLPEQGLFTRSDHYPFVQAGIPSVFLMTGFANGGEQRFRAFLAGEYHSVEDELGQPFNWRAGARFAELNYRITRELANAAAAPRWYRGSFFGDTLGGNQPRAERPATATGGSN